jgi:hypothetical protein
VEVVATGGVRAGEESLPPPPQALKKREIAIKLANLTVFIFYSMKKHVLQN